MSSLVEANNGLSADALSAAARMRTEAFRVFILVGAERFWLRGPGRPPRPADCGVWREPLPSPLTTDSPARYHRQGAIFRQNPVAGLGYGAGLSGRHLSPARRDPSEGAL